jgi:hypothetical protein
MTGGATLPLLFLAQPWGQVGQVLPFAWNLGGYNLTTTQQDGPHRSGLFICLPYDLSGRIKPCRARSSKPFLLPLSSGLMNPIGRLGGSGAS